MTYDKALRVSGYDAYNSNTANATHVQVASYTYANDGMLKEIDSKRGGTTDQQFDQVNKYDFAGRLKTTFVGSNGYSFNQTLAQT